MFEYIIFTIFFEINGQLKKRYAVESGQQCPFEFKEYAKFGDSINYYQMQESNDRLKKKIKHKEILIAITCREDEFVKGDWK